MFLVQEILGITVMVAAESTTMVAAIVVTILGVMQPKRQLRRPEALSEGCSLDRGHHWALLWVPLSVVFLAEPVLMPHGMPLTATTVVTTVVPLAVTATKTVLMDSATGNAVMAGDISRPLEGGAHFAMKKFIRVFFLFLFCLTVVNVIQNAELKGLLVIKNLCYSVVIALGYVFVTSEWWKKNVLKLRKD
ncbi:TPA: hypothetical protein ACYUTL_000055 [Serratia marcescens]